MRYTRRSLLFVALFLPLLVLMAWRGKWFPMEQAGAWFPVPIIIRGRQESKKNWRSYSPFSSFCFRYCPIIPSYFLVRFADPGGLLLRLDHQEDALYPAEPAVRDMRTSRTGFRMDSNQ